MPRVQLVAKLASLSQIDVDSGEQPVYELAAVPLGRERHVIGLMVTSALGDWLGYF